METGQCLRTWMNATLSRSWPASCWILTKRRCGPPPQVTNNGQWCEYRVACWQCLHSLMASGLSPNALLCCSLSKAPIQLLQASMGLSSWKALQLSNQGLPPAPGTPFPLHQLKSLFSLMTQGYFLLLSSPFAREQSSLLPPPQKPDFLFVLSTSLNLKDPLGPKPESTKI